MKEAAGFVHKYTCKVNIYSLTVNLYRSYIAKFGCQRSLIYCAFEAPPTRASLHRWLAAGGGVSCSPAIQFVPVLTLGATLIDQFHFKRTQQHGPSLPGAGGLADWTPSAPWAAFCLYFLRRSSFITAALLGDERLLLALPPVKSLRVGRDSNL